MGTSGVGRLSDYSRNAEIDKCEQVIENELIEEYGDYDFSRNSLIPPVVGTPVRLEVRERIVVVDISTGYSIGALSTEYEYIRQCIKVREYSFTGQITSSETTPLISIRVKLIGTKNKK